MENEFKLSPEQQNAVDHPYDSSAIVTAAAGSGKTTLLVARVIQLLSDMSLNISADSLAIMTFTKNATTSMREKLNKALADELASLADKTSDEERARYDYLKKQMFALRQASISTIDAFCLRMIKENAEAFELPLNVTIADNAKKAALQSQAMRTALQEFYGSEFTEEERAALFFSFSFEDDRALEEAILSVSEKLSSCPDPEKWIDDALGAYKDISAVEKEFLPLLDNFLELNIRRIELNSKKYSEEGIYDRLVEEVAEKRAETARKNSTLDKMENEILPAVEQYINYDQNRVSALINDFSVYKKARSLKTLGDLFEHLEDNSKDPPEQHSRTGNKFYYKALFKNISKGISETVEKLLEFKIDADAENKNLPAIRSSMESFFKLLRIYMNNYRLEKTAAGCIDFSDCERELYEKLNENNGDNEFRRQLSQRFRCIIVDEFQDSNKIQAEIFRLLGDGHLFYVGDVKQSIYSFRGADPYIMAGLCDKTNTDFKTLPLNTNFRSRKAVIDTVNAAFDGLMTPKYGGVNYTEEKLNLGCELPEPEHKNLYDSDIFLVTGAKQAGAESEKDKDMTLPRFVAGKIKELCGNEHFLVSDGKDENKNHKFRRAEYSDVIILLRTKGKIDCYRKALAELGIPSTAPKGSDFFEADEILLALNYLKVIDNPLLNEEMLKVLMSPIYRFAAEEIAQLKMGILGLEDMSDEQLREIANTYKRRSLYSCITHCMTQTAVCGKDIIPVRRKISAKLERFYNDIREFRFYMNSNSLDNLVRKIYEDTDLIAVVAAFEDSAGRVANIRQLQRLAAAFEADRGGGLGDFLRFFDRAKENSSKGIEEAARPESSANAVRIMTFHGSKGLEAPICIMSELQSTMNSADYSGNLLINFEHFMAMKHTDIKHRRKTKMMTYHAVSRFIRERQLGDELRLLYVAMTRAQEKLIMVSSISQSNYEGFNEFINADTIDPELHDEVYESSAPFKCVLNTLLQYAPMIDGETKEFTLDSIGCKISAVDSNTDPTEEAEMPEIQASTADETDGNASEEYVRKITELMKLKYSHLTDTQQQAKFTTTELAHKKSVKPISLTKPTFASGGAVSGVEKGNAYHHCMQHFPIERLTAEMSFDDTSAAVAKALDELTENRKITADEKKIVEAERIAKFFTSELGKRMLSAYSQNPENVKREQSFYAEVNGSEVRQEYNGSISIQGQVDMYFIENGEIVVVDYKSDTIENLAKEQKNYEFQVEIYMKILKKLTGMKVKEMFLYAFLADREMKI